MLFLEEGEYSKAPTLSNYTNKIDDDSIAWMATLKLMVENCRSLRGEMNISPAVRIPLAITGDKKFVNSYVGYVKGLAKLSEVEVMNELPDQDAPVAIIDNYKLMLNIQVDKDTELVRLQKEIGRLNIEIKKAQGKLGDDNFVKKAPKDVVSQEQDRLESFTQLKDKIQLQFKKLDS